MASRKEGVLMSGDITKEEAGKLAAMFVKNVCTYALIDDDSNLWQCSECGEEWILAEDGPKENNMDYCPKCGRKITEIRE